MSVFVWFLSTPCATIFHVHLILFPIQTLFFLYLFIFGLLDLNICLVFLMNSLQKYINCRNRYVLYIYPVNKNSFGNIWLEAEVSWGRGPRILDPYYSHANWDISVKFWLHTWPQLFVISISSWFVIKNMSYFVFAWEMCELCKIFFTHLITCKSGTN